MLVLPTGWLLALTSGTIELRQGLGLKECIVLKVFHDISVTHLLHPLVGQPGFTVLRLSQRAAGSGGVEVEHRGAHLAALGTRRLSLEQQGIVKVV